ncbi:MAG: hypothetical protein ACREUZ_22965 [Burkholderiales bacterium]
MLHVDFDRMPILMELERHAPVGVVVVPADAELGGRRKTMGPANVGKAAVDVARRLGDPALLLIGLATLLDLNGSEALLAEIRQTVERIVGTLAPGRLRDASWRTRQRQPAAVCAQKDGRR